MENGNKEEKQRISGRDSPQGSPGTSMGSGTLDLGTVNELLHPLHELISIIIAG